jgi:hypothetical protein
MCQISAASSQLLVDKGMEYDHSAMHRDCFPYYLRVDDKWECVDPKKEAKEWMKPLVRGRVTDLVSIPMSWFQDGM